MTPSPPLITVADLASGAAEADLLDAEARPCRPLVIVDLDAGPVPGASEWEVAVRRARVSERLLIARTDKVGGRAAVDCPSRVGGRAIAHCTGLGKAMLAWLSPEEIDARYAQVMERRTHHSIGRIDVLHRELGAVRRRGGLAIDEGECFPERDRGVRALTGPPRSRSAGGLVRRRSC